VVAVSAQSDALQEEIEQAIVANGLDNDTLGRLLRVIGAAARESAASADRVERAVEQIPALASQAMAATIAESAGRDIVAAADRSARSMVEFHHEAAKLADRKWFWKASATAALVAVGLTGGGMYSGWTLANDRIAERVSQEVRHIEGAAFVAQLAEVNDPSELRIKCEANVKQVADGYLKCTLPDVWVRGPQPQTKKAAR